MLVLMKTIVINNPAACEGGALIILKQFLDNLMIYKQSSVKYIVIVSIEELKKYKCENTEIVIVKKHSWKERIFWDNFGFKFWCKDNNINPDLIISLQNTGLNFDKKIPQIVYIHQSIPFVKKNWNILKKDERLYWMYKNIYNFFIKRFINKNTTLVVQTEWMKEEVVKKCKINENKVKVIFPDIPEININEIEKIKLKKGFNIFYPAYPFLYKNHKIIIEALKYLKDKKYDISNINVYFTFQNIENAEIFKLTNKYNLRDNINFTGKMDYKTVLQYYKSCDLIVFPSYIETVGLPLIEGAFFGKYILVSDEKYSKEVLKNYKGVKFIKYNDKKQWAKEIIDFIDNQKSFECENTKIAFENSWKDFFEMIYL